MIPTAAQLKTLQGARPQYTPLKRKQERYALAPAETFPETYTPYTAELIPPRQLFPAWASKSPYQTFNPPRPPVSNVTMSTYGAAPDMMTRFPEVPQRTQEVYTTPEPQIEQTTPTQVGKYAAEFRYEPQTEEGKRWQEYRIAQGYIPSGEELQLYESAFLPGGKLPELSEYYQKGYGTSTGEPMTGYGGYWGELVPQGAITYTDELGNPLGSWYGETAPTGAAKKAFEKGLFYLPLSFAGTSEATFNYIKDLEAAGITGKEAPPGIYTPTDEYRTWQAQYSDYLNTKWTNFYNEVDPERAAYIIEVSLNRGEITLDEANRLRQERDDYLGQILATQLEGGTTAEGLPQGAYIPEYELRTIDYEDVIPDYKGKIPSVGVTPAMNRRGLPEQITPLSPTGTEATDFDRLIDATGLAPNEKNWMKNEYGGLYSMWGNSDRTIPFIEWVNQYLGLGFEIPAINVLGEPAYRGRNEAQERARLEEQLGKLKIEPWEWQQRYMTSPGYMANTRYASSAYTPRTRFVGGY